MTSAPTRDDLAHLLTQAAETEHMLCCQYLFAGVSLKQERSEGLTYEQQALVHDWGLLLFTIARQEMEHLGLVCNLLTAIGAAPHFVRPNFPQGSNYFPVRMSLEPLSEATIKRFVCFERPRDVAPKDAFCEEAAADGPASSPPALPEYVPYEIRSIEDLYDRIAQVLRDIPLSDAELFIGPPNAQIDGSLLHVDWPRPGALGGIWDVTLFDIVDRKTAQQAIDLIIEQGEGTPGDSEFTHYRWFRQMLDEYRRLHAADPAFDPARKAVANPCLYPHDDAPTARLITNPDARDVLDLFNGVYELLLLLLVRLYAYSDENQNQITALVYCLFPLMTQIMRPIAMLLTELPADDPPGAARAAPGFEVTRAVHHLPHVESTFQYLFERFEQLAAYADALGARGIGARLPLIAENLDIMANKFRSIANGTYPPELLVPGLVRPYSQPES
ncbi:MAG: ferritin-like domain-containing protein [Gaiellaceae bacterium]